MWSRSTLPAARSQASHLAGLYPLLLGSGKQVFGGGTVPTALRLTESVTYPNGTLQLAYETSGLPAHGNLAISKEDQ
jgi:hypothetical protein